MYDIEFRSLTLTDGSEIPVDAALYPMLTEWEWETDPETKLAIRKEGDRTIRLIDEMIRLGVMRGEVRALPLLPRQMMQRLFSGRSDYQDLLQLVRTQRQVAFSVGMPFPSAYSLASVSLTYALCTYYKWRSKVGRYEEFIFDETHLTPGVLRYNPHAPTVGVYWTLGEFLDSEYTGNWKSDPDAPTGLVPEKYGDVVENQILDVWHLHMLEYEDVKDEQIEELADLLDDEGYPLSDMVALVRKVISPYTPS